MRAVSRIVSSLLFFLSLTTVSAQKENEEVDPVRSITLTTVSPIAIEGMSTWYAPATPMPEDRTTYKGNWVKLKLNRFTPLGPYKLKARKQIPIFSKPDAPVPILWTIL